MELHLAGKTVIVTGSGSNIGRAIAHTFAGEGARVVIADISAKDGLRVADEIKTSGARALFVQVDVTRPDQIEAMVSRVIEELGRIDVLVNNAGWDHLGLFIDKPREEWVREVDINFWSVINCTRAVLGHMIEQKSGAIVNVSSDAGRMGEYQEAVYSGCKGGVIAMTKAIAREVGCHGIRLNAVCPGATVGAPEDYGDSSMWRTSDMSRLLTAEAQEKMKKAYPLRRVGTPQDIARSVVFLSSDAASWVTGQTLSVSGGYTMM
ncbi:MAG: glucose 1-dehydrogenase [Desulfobacterales bacterium]|nr:glucose 1-dehydrogenase [Desulfobacterales bacterium]